MSLPLSADCAGGEAGAELALLQTAGDAVLPEFARMESGPGRSLAAGGAPSANGEAPVAAVSAAVAGGDVGRLPRLPALASPLLGEPAPAFGQTAGAAGAAAGGGGVGGGGGGVSHPLSRLILSSLRRDEAKLNPATPTPGSRGAGGPAAWPPALAAFGGSEQRLLGDASPLPPTASSASLGGGFAAAGARGAFAAPAGFAFAALDPRPRVCRNGSHEFGGGGAAAGGEGADGEGADETAAAGAAAAGAAAAGIPVWHRESSSLEWRDGSAETFGNCGTGGSLTGGGPDEVERLLANLSAAAADAAADAAPGGGIGAGGMPPDFCSPQVVPGGVADFCSPRTPLGPPGGFGVDVCSGSRVGSGLFPFFDCYSGGGDLSRGAGSAPGPSLDALLSPPNHASLLAALSAAATAASGPAEAAPASAQQQEDLFAAALLNLYPDTYGFLRGGDAAGAGGVGGGIADGAAGGIAESIAGGGASGAAAAGGTAADTADAVVGGGGTVCKFPDSLQPPAFPSAREGAAAMPVTPPFYSPYQPSAPTEGAQAALFGAAADDGAAAAAGGGGGWRSALLPPFLNDAAPGGEALSELLRQLSPKEELGEPGARVGAPAAAAAETFLPTTARTTTDPASPGDDFASPGAERSPFFADDAALNWLRGSAPGRLARAWPAAVGSASPIFARGTLPAALPAAQPAAAQSALPAPPAAAQPSLAAPATAPGASALPPLSGPVARAPPPTAGAPPSVAGAAAGGGLPKKEYLPRFAQPPLGVFSAREMKPSLGAAGAGATVSGASTAVSEAGPEAADRTALLSSTTHLSDLRGQVLSLARVQYGSRLLQRLLNRGEKACVDLVLSETLGHLASLMVDPYGNYLCQHLFEVCSHEQRLALLRALGEDSIAIAEDRRGTHSVQALITLMRTEEEQLLLLKPLAPHVLRLSMHPHGTHVMQRALTACGERVRSIIFKPVIERLEEVAQNPHGICVVKKCISTCSPMDLFPEFEDGFVERLSRCALSLMQSPYGNYAIQHALERWGAARCSAIVDQVRENFTLLSTQKFSSNVVEKTIEVASDAVVRSLAAKVLSQEAVAALTNSGYGNFVAHKLALRMTEEEAAALLQLLSEHQGLGASAAGAAGGAAGGAASGGAGGAGAGSPQPATPRSTAALAQQQLQNKRLRHKWDVVINSLAGRARRLSGATRGLGGSEVGTLKTPPAPGPGGNAAGSAAGPGNAKSAKEWLRAENAAGAAAAAGGGGAGGGGGAAGPLTRRPHASGRRASAAASDGGDNSLHSAAAAAAAGAAAGRGGRAAAGGAKMGAHASGAGAAKPKRRSSVGGGRPRGGRSQQQPQPQSQQFWG